MQGPLSTTVQSASDDCFNKNLARWFAQREGSWSGTASELLTVLGASTGIKNDSWPQSLPALYSHIELHRQVLLSLGVDVLLHKGRPRMISLRASQNGMPEGELSSNHSGNGSCDLPIDVSASETSLKKDEAATQENPPSVHSELSDSLADDVCADPKAFKGGIFRHPEEALFALVEMRMQIREQDLGRESAVALVSERATEITSICGMVVGLLQRGTVVYPCRTGAAVTMGAHHFHANLFQLCVRTGRMLQLCDAQSHSHVGVDCRRAGIGSLIIVPVFHKRQLSGAIEFLFKEKRSFSIGDVMDLERIAGVISESLSVSLRPSFVEEASSVCATAESFHGPAAEIPLPISAVAESAALGLRASNLATPAVFQMALNKAQIR
jgi:hypothetical protein